MNGEDPSFGACHALCGSQGVNGLALCCGKVTEEDVVPETQPRPRGPICSLGPRDDERRLVNDIFSCGVWTKAAGRGSEPERGIRRNFLLISLVSYKGVTHRPRGSRS